MADFNINWGSALESPDTDIEDFSDILSSWGQPGSTAGGFDFKMPTTGATPGILGTGAPAGGDWQTKWLGGTTPEGMRTNGIIPVGLSALSGLTGAYLGWQQFNLAKDQLAQNKKIFNLNFANQAQSINTQLEDRQRARVASNPGAYKSVGEYMDENKVSTRGI
jgi:hypothetical protein